MMWAMIKKEIKEKLLSELNKVNMKYFEEVLGGECHEDSIGNDSHHLYYALRYVPNKVIKRWIKESSKEIKKEREIKENEQKN